MNKRYVRRHRQLKYAFEQAGFVVQVEGERPPAEHVVMAGFGVGDLAWQVACRSTEWDEMVPRAKAILKYGF